MGNMKILCEKICDNPLKIAETQFQNAKTRFQKAKTRVQKAKTRVQNAETDWSRISFASTWMEIAQKICLRVSLQGKLDLYKMDIFIIQTLLTFKVICCTTIKPVSI